MYFHCVTVSPCQRVSSLYRTCCCPLLYLRSHGASHVGTEREPPPVVKKGRRSASISRLCLGGKHTLLPGTLLRLLLYDCQPQFHFQTSRSPRRWLRSRGGTFLRATCCPLAQLQRDRILRKFLKGNRRDAVICWHAEHEEPLPESKPSLRLKIYGARGACVASCEKHASIIP